MKYVAVDVETTGLDRENDQIVEFAAVFDTLGSKTLINNLPIFHTYVSHDRYQGSAFAINMNAKAFEVLAKPCLDDVITPIEELAKRFWTWINFQYAKHGLELTEFVKGKDLDKAKLVIAGKNYAAFDAHFIDRIPEWGTFFKPHHRTIDPAALFLDAEDKVPPDLSTCLKRAGFEGVVKHTAAADAYDVIRLLRRCYGHLGTVDQT